MTDTPDRTPNTPDSNPSEASITESEGGGNVATSVLDGGQTEPAPSEATTETASEAAPGEGEPASEPEFEPTPLFASSPVVPLTPEASPDGAWLAYLLEHAGGKVELWLSPTDGGEPVQAELAFTPIVERDPDTGRLIRGPQWSPDGAAIALAGHVEGENRTGIWLIPSPVASAPLPAAAADNDTTDAAAGGESDASSSDANAEDAVSASASAEDAGDPAADSADAAQSADSPETESESGTEVVAAEASEVEEGAAGEPVEIVAREAMASPRLLTWGPGSERSPRWSPDGNLLAFVSHRDGRDTIALATTGGDEPTIAELLTWSGQDDREPAWSRDGKFLAFTRQRREGVEHADIVVYSPENGELTNLSEAKTSAVRHSLDWVSGRNLVAYVTQDGEWLSISVINADNKAGWAVTRESGDKTQPRFHPTEARLLYVRSEGFATVCCERGLHASGAVALDPSEGIVHQPVWLQDKRLAYGFSAAQKPFGFLAQENTASAERDTIQIPRVPDTAGVAFRQPVPLEFAIGEDEQFSGMLYRTADVDGDVPATVYLPDGPLAIRRGDFNLEEQALASSGMAVFTPLLHGSTGFGQAIEGDLAELSGSEIEVSDIAEAGYGLGESEGVDAERLALVGVGYGGALALLTAGARPGVYSAVVAVDPITDWSIELGECDPAWRTWVSSQYGMPLTNPDKYALRTPATFSSVINVPLILVSRATAPVYRRAQTELFAAYLDAADVAYDLVEVPDEPLAATLERIGQRLSRHFGEAKPAESDESPADATEDAPAS